MYEVSFAKLSEMFFRGTTWPPVQYISSLVDDDSVFCLLYKVSPDPNAQGAPTSPELFSQAVRSKSDEYAECGSMADSARQH